MIRTLFPVELQKDIAALIIKTYAWEGHRYQGPAWWPAYCVKCMRFSDAGHFRGDLYSYCPLCFRRSFLNYSWQVTDSDECQQ